MDLFVYILTVEQEATGNDIKQTLDTLHLSQ